MAVAIPKGLHQDKFSQLHSYLKNSKFNGAKISRAASGFGMVVGNLSLVSGILTGDPNNMFNAFSSNGNPEDYVGRKVFQDWDANLYFEVTRVETVSVNSRDGNGNIISSRVISRTVTADVYSDFIWDDEEKRYKGINKVDTKTETWNYDKNGKREIKSENNPYAGKT